MSKLTTKEFQEILEKLNANDPTLTDFNLHDNEIGLSGAKDLSIALKDNRALTSLFLSLNKIGPSGRR